MTNDTITWRGEEWEVVKSVLPPYGTIALNDNQEALIIKRKPKPLKKEWQVIERDGRKNSTHETFESASHHLAYLKKQWPNHGPYRIILMREVRDDN